MGHPAIIGELAANMFRGVPQPMEDGYSWINSVYKEYFSHILQNASRKEGPPDFWILGASFDNVEIVPLSKKLSD